MPRFGLATLNHSPLHGLPTQWEAHVDAAASAGFDALAPDIFWLRQLEEEGVALETVASRMRDRGLACMEIAGIAIGTEELTDRELAENLRYAKAFDAEFVNARILEPIDEAVVERVKRCAVAFREEGAADGRTRIALEFSRGTKLNGVAQTRELVEAVAEEGIGVTLDTWHFFLHPEGPDWTALEALPIDQLANVQLSDGVAYGEGEFGPATMDRRRMPGDGGFDLARTAGLLASRGFDGAVVLEVLSAEERARPLSEYAERAMRSSLDWWSPSGARR
jgi:sugar phosphate isomerase/epimerase